MTQRHLTHRPCPNHASRGGNTRVGGGETRLGREGEGCQWGIRGSDQITGLKWQGGGGDVTSQNRRD